MNTPITMKKICSLFLLLAVMPLFWGCNSEDNLEAIFLGKTFKTTGIFYDKKKGDPVLICDDTHKEDCSLYLNTLIAEGNNFTIRFTMEEFTATLLGSTVSGTWKANGKNQNISLTITSRSGEESEPWALAYLEGLERAYKYEGDTTYLTIKFRDEEGTKKYILYHIYR
ncbi:MAG: DUF4847 domain-containing protein [Bacteroides sp.]|nr:DUF4847 domain-containing protein [Bacteroides sp.]